MRKMGIWVVLGSLAICGCTVDNPDYCDTGKPCTDPATPWCDLEGDVGPKNTCQPAPSGVDADVSADASALTDAATGLDASMPSDAATADAAPSDASAGDASASDGGVVVPVTKVVAGGNHTCALFEDGTVACWGYGSLGRLGYGSLATIGDDEPASAAGKVDVGGVVTDIAAGAEHTCALLASGNVRCWGRNNAGQLGYGNTETIGDDETPATAGDVMVGGMVSQVVAGSFFTCARLVSGSVRCWGDGSQGKLGYGNTANIGDDETPASAGDVPLGATAIHLSAGNFHVCAMVSGNNVRCWGDGAKGKLGYGNENDIGDTEAPSTVGNVAVGGVVYSVDAGANHTCAILNTGGLRCWGLNNFGQLGRGDTTNIGDTELPNTTPLVDVGGVNVLQVSGGGAHTCALLTDRNVRCWGHGQYGRLGHGDEDHVGDDEAVTTKPTLTIGGAGFVNLIDSGGEHTCITTSEGRVRCWGRGGFGALGYGNMENIGDNELPSATGDVPVD